MSDVEDGLKRDATWLSPEEKRRSVARLSTMLLATCRERHDEHCARERLRATLRMLANPSMVLLSPLFFYTGIGVTFYAGQFTRQICAQVSYARKRSPATLAHTPPPFLPRACCAMRA